jgi:hypothetical protein
MRKRLIESERPAVEPPPGEWLDLAREAEVELTSEAEGFPIESALTADDGPGWRAATAGEQVIRMIFDQPRRLERVRLEFEEWAGPRTQEFVLSWSPEPDGPAREIVRQQWNFHQPEGEREVEDFGVDLAGVRVLELTITPDVSGGTARASLRSLRVA